MRKAVSGSRMAVAAVIVVVLLGLGAYLYSTSTTPGPSSSSSTTPPPTTTTTSTSKTMQHVNFMMSFAPEGFESEFYYGLDQGIYAQNGIDIAINPGTTSAVISAISAGKMDFGYADTYSLASSVARNNITNVRAIAIVAQNTPYGLVYNKAVISKLGDLNGKTLGTFQGSGSFLLFQTFAKTYGINMSSIKVVYAQPATYNQLVALGQADFITDIVNDIANVAPVAAQNNIKLGIIQFANYSSFNIYGHGLIASTDMINNHPQLVQAFLNATFYSLVRAAHNPTAAVNALIAHNPSLKFDQSLDDFVVYLKVAIPNVNSTSHPLTLGWIDQQKMQRTIDIMASAYAISNPPTTSSLYTNQFVQKP